MPPAVRQRFSALEAEHNAAREEWYQREDVRCEANEKARATAITKALAASRARTAAKKKDAASKALVRSANKYRSASSRLVESRKEHETSAKKLRAAEKVYQKKLAGICKKHRESVRKEQKRHADSLAKLAEAMGKRTTEARGEVSECERTEWRSYRAWRSAEDKKRKARDDLISSGGGYEEQPYEPPPQPPDALRQLAIEWDMVLYHQSPYYF